MSNVQKKTLNEIIEEEKLSVYAHEIDSYGTDKHIHSYAGEAYEKLFSRFRDKQITLVEIGVRGGASIQLWKKYFSNIQIYGLDNLQANRENNIPVNDEWVSGDNVKLIIGDAYLEEVANQVPNNIDIFIDDGPHSLESHLLAIELYLPKMNNTGLFVIEDISYDANAFLYDKIPEELKECGTVYDFGPHTRLLVIDCSKK